MDYQRLLDTTEQILILRGGRGSGNWAHSGRKGKKGGSGKGGGFKRIGVKPGAGRKEIKQASRQTRAKDERGKGAATGKPQIGNLQKSATPISKTDAVKEYDSFHKNATAKENEVMIDYQETSYHWMNDHLRFGDLIDDDDKKDIQRLDKAIDKAPRLPKDTVLHRATEIAAYESQLGADPHQWAGKIFKEKGYMSTTRDPDQVFEGVQVEIRAPKGAKTVYFGELPGGVHNKEEEFLMARGTKMAVTGVDFGGPDGNSVQKVYTEIIDQP